MTVMIPEWAMWVKSNYLALGTQACKYETHYSCEDEDTGPSSTTFLSVWPDWIIFLRLPQISPPCSQFRPLSLPEQDIDLLCEVPLFLFYPAVFAIKVELFLYFSYSPRATKPLPCLPKWANTRHTKISSSRKTRINGRHWINSNLSVTEKSKPSVRRK